MQIEVIRSARRKRTVQATIKNDLITIRIPHKMSKADEIKVVKEMAKKLIARQEKNQLNSDEKLLKRAEYLNKRYFEGNLKISSVEFVCNQKRRFGSCAVKKGDIRISSVLAKAPPWVLDFVLIHEMSHLLFPDHSKKFWECVYRFPLTERAKGYLIAISCEKDDQDNYESAG